MSVTVWYALPSGLSRRRVPAKSKTKPPTRVARMLALAYEVDEFIESGRLKSQSEAAAKLGLSRARLTQVMNLLNLSADIQSAILEGSLNLSERRLRAVAAVAEWAEQRPLLAMHP